MCDFGRTQGILSDDEILSAFDDVLGAVGRGVQRLHLGPGGSFFTDSEVSPVVRQGVIRRLEGLPFLRYLGIETRAPFVDEECLERLMEDLPLGVRAVTLGFGLECVSDLPRMAAINKGYGPKQIEHALATMRAVSQRHPDVELRFEAYVMLRPLFMTEQEAIDEALATIAWAMERDAETAVLFLNTVKPRTLQHLFHAEPDVPAELRYEPPYYRTAIEVLRRLPSEWRERTVVLGPQSAVEAVGMPRGCSLCSWPLNGALVAHNLYRDPGLLHAAAEIACPCRSQWESELLVDAPPLSERIERGVEVAHRILDAAVTPMAGAPPPSAHDPADWRRSHAPARDRATR